MHWKYYLKSGDLVNFWYEDEDGHRRKFWGTVDGIPLPDGYEVDADGTIYPEDKVGEDDISPDDIDINDFDVRITSGQQEVTVPMEDIETRTKKEDRETDIPGLSEDLRLTGGVPNAN